MCDKAENCTGSSGTCPADAKQPSDHVCRPEASDCDTEEKCDGTSNDCPEDLDQCSLLDAPLIAPTATTCDQFRTNTAATLSQVQYSTKGQPINAVNPGVFFFYDEVHLSDTADIQVTQTNDRNWTRKIGVLQLGQIVLYTTSCVKVQNLVVTFDNSTGIATVQAVPAGSYILGIKYDPTTLVGFTGSQGKDNTYEFCSEIVIGNDPPLDSGCASIDVKLKHGK